MAEVSKILSIIVASNRPHNMLRFLFNLSETCDDPKRFEVLIKIDEGDDVMREALETAQSTYPYEIRFIQTAREDGYYTLHHGYQQLLEISDPQTYFIFLVNEEVLFTNVGWDKILEGYIGLYPDHLFRLKISMQKYRNYYSFHDCGPCPENYAFFTRRWMELVEGFGDCWGPDGWHQFIDYHMGLDGHFRSIPIRDIKIGSEEAGRELTQEQIQKRDRRIQQEWWRMSSPKIQQEFRRLAIKIKAYFWAMDKKLPRFVIADNAVRQCILVRETPDAPAMIAFYYHISPLYVHFVNIAYIMRCYRWGYVTPNFKRGYIVSTHESPNPLVKYAVRALRLCIIELAGLLIKVLPSFENMPPARDNRFLQKLHKSFVKRSNEIKKIYGLETREGKEKMSVLLAEYDATRQTFYEKDIKEETEKIFSFSDTKPPAAIIENKRSHA